MEVGIIVLWAGAVVDIPSGFQLCDGTNGTPDLRNRFVVGAGSTYNPDDTGGTTSHSHYLLDSPPHDLGAGTDTSVETDAKSHLPPYYSLAYIQRI